MSRICIVPRVEGSGGMASFRLKFEVGLHARGVDVTHDLSEPSDAVLVIAGTKNLLPLWRAKCRGLRIVQRLDGINWVQRARWTGPRYHLRAEYGNAMLSFIRARFADCVIYQSQFIRGWWEKWYGPARAPVRVILNGVDLNVYSPASEIPAHPPYRLLVVEGSLAGGLDTGLRASIRLAEILNEKFPMELLIAGRADAAKQNELTRKSRVPIRFLGVVPREQIPDLDRSAHLLFSAEINPPCP
ncbi:MAG TPA: glycosyltransferase, partial [Anaerolineales bacterium]|nr:glycosyltransferase [Anaerolineales bacterium]